MFHIRVAVLSDCRLFCEGLKEILQFVPGTTLVGCDDGSTFGALLQDKSPHIVLVDGHMQRAFGLLHRDAARPWAIVLAAEIDDSWAVRALESGARGVLTGGALASDLSKAILVVHEGQIWARSEVVTRIVERMAGVMWRNGDSMPLERLSNREAEIVRSAANGLSNKEIASRLHISQATVKSHLSRIFQKLAVRDRGQLNALYHRTLTPGAFPRATRRSSPSA